MKVTGEWLTDPGVQDLLAALEGAGLRALIVGGAVRNAVLGLAVADVDIACDARPEIVSDIAEKAGFRVVPTGIDHGTVTIIAHGRALEVTSFRRDVETFGRRAVVAFSSDLREDAARRDFTMNAFYADSKGQVIDPLGGLPDLLARRVRFVGDAQARIREDYLRILRFFRFHACYGDPQAGLDAEGLAACAANLDGLSGLSRERVGAEMRKLLAAADPAPALAAMSTSGVLAQVLPGADARAMSVLVHFESGQPAPWLGRLAVLGGSDPGAALRLSRAEIRDLGRIRDEIGRTLSPAALGWKLGRNLAPAALLARSALLETPPPPDWHAQVVRGAASRFPVRPADLMPGLQGPELGARLQRLQGEWLASDLTLDRAALLRGSDE